MSKRLCWRYKGVFICQRFIYLILDCLAFGTHIASKPIRGLIRFISWVLPED
ncbi:hypothetical protein ES708_19850 [subsurface metagenome]